MCIYGYAGKKELSENLENIFSKTIGHAYCSLKWQRPVLNFVFDMTNSLLLQIQGTSPGFVHGKVLVTVMKEGGADLKKNNSAALVDTKEALAGVASILRAVSMLCLNLSLRYNFPRYGKSKLLSWLGNQIRVMEHTIPIFGLKSFENFEKSMYYNILISIALNGRRASKMVPNIFDGILEDLVPVYLSSLKEEGKNEFSENVYDLEYEMRLGLRKKKILEREIEDDVTALGIPNSLEMISLVREIEAQISKNETTSVVLDEHTQKRSRVEKYSRLEVVCLGILNVVQNTSKNDIEDSPGRLLLFMENFDDNTKQKQLYELFGWLPCFMSSSIDITSKKPQCSICSRIDSKKQDENRIEFPNVNEAFFISFLNLMLEFQPTEKSLDVLDKLVKHRVFGSHTGDSLNILSSFCIEKCFGDDSLHFATG